MNNINFSFFFLNDKNLGYMSTAIDILKWRTVWYKEMKSNIRTQSTSFNNIKSNVRILPVSNLFTNLVFKKSKHSFKLVIKSLAVINTLIF